jgi:hypothetical protein
MLVGVAVFKLADRLPNQTKGLLSATRSPEWIFEK